MNAELKKIVFGNPTGEYFYNGEIVDVVDSNDEYSMIKDSTGNEFTVFNKELGPALTAKIPVNST